MSCRFSIKQTCKGNWSQQLMWVWLQWKPAGWWIMVLSFSFFYCGSWPPQCHMIVKPWLLFATLVLPHSSLIHGSDAYSKTHLSAQWMNGRDEADSTGRGWAHLTPHGSASWPCVTTGWKLLVRACVRACLLSLSVGEASRQAARQREGLAAFPLHQCRKPRPCRMGDV